MDDVQKCRVRLAHWIDHNLDHLKGYLEVAQILEAGGHEESAVKIREGIRLIESANAQFQKALAGVSLETEEASGHDHAGTHSHPHVHEHTHVHCHDDVQGHSHAHSHGHSDEHAHGHCCESSHNHCSGNNHKH